MLLVCRFDDSTTFSYNKMSIREFCCGCCSAITKLCTFSSDTGRDRPQRQHKIDRMTCCDYATVCHLFEKTKRTLSFAFFNVGLVKSFLILWQIPQKLQMKTCFNCQLIAKRLCVCWECDFYNSFTTILKPNTLDFSHICKTLNWLEKQIWFKFFWLFCCFAFFWFI